MAELGPSRWKTKSVVMMEWIWSNTRHLVPMSPVLLLIGWSSSWDVSKQIEGVVTTSPQPANFEVITTVTSDGAFDAISFEVLLSFSPAEVTAEPCADLGVVVRDGAGDVVEDDATADDEGCNSLLMSLPTDDCVEQLPGRCRLAYQIEVSSSQELVLEWEFLAYAGGSLGRCNDEAPATAIGVVLSEE